MTQQWLTRLGLALDFAGFMLLLREWWLAFFNERRQIEMEEQLERMRAMRNLRPARPAGEPNPFERIERMQDEQAIRKAREIHRAAMAARNTFILSVLLIVGGFVLQIVGAGRAAARPGSRRRVAAPALTHVCRADALTQPTSAARPWPR